MKNWKTKKLSEVCAKITDGTHQTPRYFSDGVIFLSSKNVTSGKIDWVNIKYIDEKQHLEMHKRVAPKVNDILLAKNGTTGVAAMVDRDVVFDIYVSLALLRPLEGLLPDYLLHFINSPLAKNQFNKRLKGIGVPNLHLEEIREVEIPLPPLPEQQRIVAILDEAFAAIAKAKANAEQNLKNAKELFESYLQGVFENKGEGWEENILKDVCELKSGTTISPSLERTEGDVLYTKVGDMNLPDNEVEINTSSRFVNSREIKINQIIPEGAIIFPKRGGAIATNKKRKIIKPTIVDLNTMAIIPSKKIDKDYFFHWFHLFDLNIISNGANIPQINNYSFDEVYIPYPKSLTEQQSIVQKLDALSNETKKLEAIYQQKINDLEELKKSILQKAFAGELRSPEGAGYTNDVATPIAKKKTITSPERA
jgi:type I restriction enzyme S subunit